MELQEQVAEFMYQQKWPIPWQAVSEEVRDSWLAQAIALLDFIRPQIEAETKTKQQERQEAVDWLNQHDGWQAQLQKWEKK